MNISENVVLSLNISQNNEERSSGAAPYLSGDQLSLSFPVIANLGILDFPFRLSTTIKSL